MLLIIRRRVLTLPAVVAHALRACDARQRVLLVDGGVGMGRG